MMEEKVYVVKLQLDATDALATIEQLKNEIEHVIQLQDKVNEGAKG